MSVSLEKSSVREYTPEHLMDEEEAVRKFCSQRENSEESEIMVTTERDNLPAEKAESKENKTFETLFVMICSLLLAAGVVLFFAIFIASFYLM